MLRSSHGPDRMTLAGAGPGSAVVSILHLAANHGLARGFHAGP
jgi:hypothetical protein